MSQLAAPEITTLIVDDQRDIRLLLRILIDAANDGLSVIGEAASGPEAIAEVERIEPVVVVFDEMMPDMTGVEAAAQVRRLRPAQIMVLCTAYLDERVIERAREAGMDAWLAKQDVADLPDLIRSLVAARRPQRPD
jgi:two-component system response regulator DesR